MNRDKYVEHLNRYTDILPCKGNHLIEKYS